MPALNSNEQAAHRRVQMTDMSDTSVTLHAAVMASGPLTYLVGCGIASNDSIRFATSSIVWCLQCDSRGVNIVLWL